MPTVTPDARDPRSLRAIAHPLRLRLYEALVAGGPATAARLSREVPGAPGSLSYHLRQLALYGYAEEVPELAVDRRERWWRAVPGGAHWSQGDVDSSPGTQQAHGAAQAVFFGRLQERLDDWQRHGVRNYGSDWGSAAMSMDTLLHLNVQEMADLTSALGDVVELWAERSRAHRRQDYERREVDAGAAGSPTSSGTPDPGQRQPVFLVLHAFPFSVSAAGQP